ncbi:hypothetical protein [Pseudomonas sp. BEA3.1]|uniref:hypothetical protein n=1 Tax=Pseudomonas sp. BEA3.1 TaxID=3083251 RepID=UPI0029642715|nr:hypothetical protein [Pseudomonas sp. BEA3.1]MDW2775214.1 hypothetical protein [Pseudomonas sp. BEA3.1]
MPTENRSSNTEMATQHPQGRRERFQKWVLSTKHPVLGYLDGTWLARGDDREGYADKYVQGLWVAYKEFGQPAPQPHPEPIAWMVGTAFWWTKEEAERDAAETGLPIVGLGPMTDPAEVERLRRACEAEFRSVEVLNEANQKLQAQLTEAQAMLKRCEESLFNLLCFGVPEDRTEADKMIDELRALSASAEPSKIGNSEYSVAEPSAPVERDERAEFEADWAHRMKVAGHRERANAFYRIQPNDRYRWNDVQDAWEAWQARAALERKPQVKS